MNRKVKFNINIKSNLKYQTNKREVKFDIGLNEIRQDKQNIRID